MSVKSKVYYAKDPAAAELILAEEIAELRKLLNHHQRKIHNLECRVAKLRKKAKVWKYQTQYLNLPKSIDQ